MNQMLKLLADNRSAPRRFEVKAEAEEATVYLYDVVVSDDFFGGVSAQAFVKELNAITAPLIHLRINSPGGDVFAARAIEQAIREHKSKVVAHIDGYAASAASYVALAADEVVIAEGGFYMIHKAWTFAYGNADDLVETAALLEKVDDSLVTTYAKETGQTPEQIREWMAAETWFSAQEAVDNGFADRLAEDAPKASAWNLSAYAKAPKSAQASAAARSAPIENAEAMAPKFSNGDRVVVKGDPHMQGHQAGLVQIVSSEPTYGILFDGTDDVHKWYVESELDAADDAGSQPSEEDMQMCARDSERRRHLDARLRRIA